VLAGRYELAERIGAGGMGVVHRAHDTVFGRDVAVKLLNRDVPADSVAATRFRAEARITGQLQHPGVPPAYDLGTLPNGQPFLAMKLVKGQTLHELLKQRSTSEGLSRFLAIFEQVCHAVGYAHARGIVHRDLKPANVMVGAHGEVQVMDWGLAKVLEDRHSPAPDDGKAEPAATIDFQTEIALDESDSSETRTGSVLGTPWYMPPEQAAGDIRSLDARSDVFGLGAMLCEILTGEPPYNGRNAHDVRLQALRWETSHAFAQLNACGADPELVALCKQCLACKQEDRPANGTAVAQRVADIRQAAEARARQAELEQQRRKAVQWAGTAIAVVLLAGLGLSLWQMQRARLAEAKAREHAAQAARNAARAERNARQAARNALKAQRNAQKARQAEELAKKNAAEALRERDAKAEALRAEELARQLAEKQRQQAETNLGYARKANEILGSVFSALDPKTRYETIAELRNALRDNLTRAADQLDGSAIGEPLVVAEMQNTLGLSLLGLGEPQSAIAVFERALATRKAALAADDPKVLDSMYNLASAYQAAGRLEEALPLHEQALELRKVRLGPEHLDTLNSMNSLAVCYGELGRLQDALLLHEQTLALRQAKLGPDHPDTLTSMNNLAYAYRAVGRLDEAVPLYERALAALKEKLGPSHPYTLTSMASLAGAYRAADRLDQALPLYEQTLALLKEKLGLDHPDTLMGMNNLAGAYQAAGKLDEALVLFQQAVALYRARLGTDHPGTLTSMNNLALAYQAAGRLNEALPLFEETLELLRQKLGPNHPLTLTSMASLAGAYRAAQQLDKALPLYEQSLTLRQATLGPDHPETLVSMNNLAAAYSANGRQEEALQLHEQAAAGFEKLGFLHEHAGPIVNNTIRAYEAARHFEKAEQWRRKWLLHVKQTSGPESLAYANELAALALVLAHQKKFVDAESALRQCLAIRQQQQPEGWTTYNIQVLLGEILLLEQKYAEAEPFLKRGYEGLKASTDAIPPEARSQRLTEAVARLIALYTALKRPEEVQAWQAERQRIATGTK
jgi:tetratricopeptide (TPR) repeat protein